MNDNKEKILVVTPVCIKPSHISKGKEESFYCLAKTTILYDKVGANLKKKKKKQY